VLASTWGPTSLLRQRPNLAAELTERLPHDSYQLGLVVHPNERAGLSAYDLAQQLDPAVASGLVLADSYEAWGALLVAADAMVTDHGSSALYAAALGLPLVSVYDGGGELIPGSPMDRLLADIPFAAGPDDVKKALDTHHSNSSARALRHATAAFAEPGRALELMRTHVYDLLDLDPPHGQPVAAPLPPPTAPARTADSFAVRVHAEDGGIRIERFPQRSGVPADHLAAEPGRAGEREIQSASLLYRRATPGSGAPHLDTWTAAGWTAHILDSYPTCRTAAVILSPTHCVARLRDGGLLSMHIRPCRAEGRVISPDPAAALSALHFRSAGVPHLPATMNCLIDRQVHECVISSAEEADSSAPI
jgi:hypothetical protein